MPAIAVHLTHRVVIDRWQASSYRVSFDQSQMLATFCQTFGLKNNVSPFANPTRLS